MGTGRPVPLPLVGARATKEMIGRTGDLFGLMEVEIVGGMWTARFWKDSAERATRTFAQALAAALGAGAAGLLSVAWVDALSIAGMATVLSFLTSVGAMNVGEKGSASLVAPAAASGQPAPPVGGPETA
jgi:Putative lactococcus lactis phage r1t holin